MNNPIDMLGATSMQNASFHEAHKKGVTVARSSALMEIYWQDELRLMRKDILNIMDRYCKELL